MVPDHVKTYRPQILLLCGRPSARTALLDFAHCLTKKVSLLICGHVEKGPVNQRNRHNLINKTNAYFRKRKMNSFYEIKEDRSFSSGAKSLMELVGIGKLRPNVVLMGFKSDWQDSSSDEVLEYFRTIQYVA